MQLNKIFIIFILLVTTVYAVDYKKMKPIDKNKCDYMQCSEMMELFNPTLADKIFEQISKEQNNLNKEDKYYQKAIQIINGDIETFIIKKPLEECDYSNPMKQDIVKKAKIDRKEFLEIIVPNYKLAFDELKKSMNNHKNKSSAVIAIRLLKSLINYKDKELDNYYLSRLNSRYNISKKEYYKYFSDFTSFLVLNKVFDGLFTMGEINEYGINQKINLNLALQYYKSAITYLPKNSKEYFDTKVKLQKLNKDNGN